eukprot:TRINITY_DN1432_c1_g1_i1.p1 TRINITY_DN1432_c1_g1~~TRINITY_DN1432_c1_g1_i1.p1  ORF type:complete len:285 (-),score=30.33 TRINITY_DN1432_c1_g1_i1:269-1123(-)
MSRRIPSWSRTFIGTREEDDASATTLQSLCPPCSDSSDSESEADAATETDQECPRDAEGKGAIAIADLPPFPKRAAGYFTEPICGVTFVCGLSAALVAGVQRMAPVDDTFVDNQALFHHFAVVAIYSEAVVAVACMLYILCGNAGVLARSEASCYPIPFEVEEKLLRGESLTGMRNIQKLDDASNCRQLYCVRCLVWRRAPRRLAKVHHCSVCQRCVEGFDHHCGVFGRCIVDGNLCCFYTMIAMMFAGIATFIANLWLTANTLVAASGELEPASGNSSVLWRF